MQPTKPSRYCVVAPAGREAEGGGVFLGGIQMVKRLEL